uniref:Uncharacterized protein n=1 Tax=Globisporangium ultimum (strain ATCC 200006 / CBS 805.95 / DAOM BR144) TaxID=431595 RepID=K3W901_GLOUD
MELCVSDKLRVLETLLTGSADACSLWNSVAEVLDAPTAALPTRVTCRGVANDTTAEDDDLLSGLQLDDTLLELSVSGFDVPGPGASDVHIGELDGVFDDSKVPNSQTASWFPTPEVDNTTATKAIAPAGPSSTKADIISIDDKEKRPAQVTGKKRNRVKDELEYLRAHVVELETRLRSLQPETTTHDDSSSVESSTHPLGGMWKRVATRQREQKQKAEVENTRLRELLEGQLRVVRSLSKLLQKLPDLNWLESRQQHSSMAKMLSSPAPSVDVFDLLLQRLETLYPQLDTVMAESGLFHGSMAREIRSGQLKTDAYDRVFLEVIDCSVMPFDFHATGAAVWKRLT